MTRDAVPDVSRRHFAAYMSQGSKNPDGLIAFISAFFHVDVEIDQFVGSWLQLEPDDCWEMGGLATLGRTTSIGNRVWSRAAKFRLRIGPLDRERYERFLPGNEGFDRLEGIVRSYIGDTLDWDVQLILKGDEVPRAMLGGVGRTLIVGPFGLHLRRPVGGVLHRCGDGRAFQGLAQEDAHVRVRETKPGIVRQPQA